MRRRLALAKALSDFTLRKFKQNSRMAALTDQQDFNDEQNLADVFSVFEEIRANNDVPDVVITVRPTSLFNSSILRVVMALR